jgi:hypothetical protein
MHAVSEARAWRGGCGRTSVMERYSTVPTAEAASMGVKSMKLPAVGLLFVVDCVEEE